MGKNNAALKATLPTAPPETGVVDSVLSSINDKWLVPRTLTPLTSLGVQSDGWRLTGVGGSHDNPWYSVVEFGARDAHGRSGRVQPMRCMANTARGGRGCILVVMLNDEYVVTVRQLRLPVERFTTELMRAFASAEAVTTILDRSIQRVSAGKSDIQDETLLAEARNLLGREVGALLTQPGIAVEEITRLGNVSEWADSMTLTEVILVRLAHPDIESLKQTDLGPVQMKIDLYSMSQLLSQRQRKMIGMQDQASLSGIALAWAHLRSQGKAIQPTTQPVLYTRVEPTAAESLAQPAHRRTLNDMNKRLKRMESAAFTHLGVPGPTGVLLGVDECRWFTCRQWTITRFQWCRHSEERLPYFMRDLHYSRYRHEEAMVVIVNRTHLLTVRAHHLPFLTDRDYGRAWCNRTPTLLADTRNGPDNELSQRLGETDARLRIREPGGALVARALRLGPIETEILDTLHEDTGMSRITRPIRLVHLTLDDAEVAIQTINKKAPRRARLALTPIADAARDPERHGIRDQQSLSSLLIAAERIGALSPSP